MTVLFGGAFAPPIVLPLLVIGYLIAFTLSSRSTNPRVEVAPLLSGMALLGWTFITIVIYGLAYLHKDQPRTEQVVFLKLLPWYTLWLVYSAAITLGAIHGTARRVVRNALKLVQPLPHMATRHRPDETTVVAVESHAEGNASLLAITTTKTNLESAQTTLDSAQTTLDSAQETVQTARTEHAFAVDRQSLDESAKP